MKNDVKQKLIYFYLIVYSIINLLFLTKFPFMHSDESWLSGLTNSMLENGMSSTESFFDLVPRYPHAIKSIFHFIQMGFLKIIGDSLFSFRIISLLFGLVIIYLVYLIGNKLFNNKIYSLILAIIVSIDIQFVYCSHFARQEIIILAGMLLAFYIVIKNIDNFNIKHNILVGVIIGLLIGVHPNSFIVALVIGSVYIYYIFIEKKISIKKLIGLISIVLFFATIYVAISFIFDPNFITNYLKYGSELGVTNNFIIKGSGIFTFYQKLFLQISGTYYTPNIHVQFVLFALIFLYSLIGSFKDRKILLYLIPIVAINIGYIIIGRYSQPSIIFIFPFFYLLLFYLLSKLKKRRMIIISSIVTLVILINSIVFIIPSINNDYTEYINHIDFNVPNEYNVLVNLNGAYAFEKNKIFDYRNLFYLDDYNLTFEKYIIKNDIKYIIYNEEIDYIFDNRPTWNIVYGNTYPFYEDMKEYLNDKCELVYLFNSPYAMRITRYSDYKEWFVKIYKVKR